MPYPGVPQNQTAKLDDCVKAVKSKMKNKPSDPKKAELKAIAICRAQLKI